MSKKLYFLDPAETLDELQDYFFPPYITLAHMFHAPPDWSLKERTLKQYQLQYVLEGEADYLIEDILYRTTKGDLLLHCPDESHTVTTFADKGYVCLSIVFHFGNTEYPLRSLLSFGQHQPMHPHFIGNFSEQAIENQLSELIHHYRQPGLYHQQFSQNLLMNVLLTLAEHCNDKIGTLESRESSGTAKLILIRNFIDKRLQKGFRLDELKSITGWSRNYIIQQFKQVFGMTPFQYLIWIRIEKAKELALQSGFSFSEIAEQVGYSDIHSFGKIFKRKTDMSLSQFVDTLFKDTPDR